MATPTIQMIPKFYPKVLEGLTGNLKELAPLVSNVTTALSNATKTDACRYMNQCGDFVVDAGKTPAQRSAAGLSVVWNLITDHAAGVMKLFLLRDGVWQLLVRLAVWVLLCVLVVRSII